MTECHCIEDDPELHKQQPSRYAKDPVTNCWVWLRSINQAGDPILPRRKHHILARYFYYEYAFGTLPQKSHVQVACGNRLCVHPCHLVAVLRGLPSFWHKVDKQGPNGCWLWTGTRLSNGYGVISIKGRSVRA